MIFSSVPFLYFFLPLVLVSYTLVPKRFKNGLLLASNLIFYAWGERLLTLIFMGSIFSGWLLGLLTEKYRGRPAAKFFAVFSVVLNLGLLGYFKYADFFIGNISRLLGTDTNLLSVALPIGISFYTFQVLSYNVDVYRGDVAACRSLIDFGLYVSFFPQLIAGPIVRFKDIEPQLKCRTQTLDDTAEGIRRFAVGLGKKVLIANVLGELCGVYRETQGSSVLFCWLYAIGYTLQIYFDFSGYSDMAIGLGRMFGFRLIENFDYPYVSSSVTEFWRRWHISLGSWFRDYVYIPMGGNRKGKVRQILNIMTVWMLTGFWHGAEWNFIFWGLFYGILLLFEKLFFKKFTDRHKPLGHIYLLFAVVLGFVLFGASGTEQLLSDVSGLFGVSGLPLATRESLYCLRSYGFTMLIAILGSTPLPKKLWRRLPSKITDAAEPVLTVLFIMLTVTAYLVDGSFNPFLYFRF